MILGSHVSFGKNQLLGSVEEAISYGANTFMFYTGAPQNTIRKAIDKDLVIAAKNLMKNNNIDINNVICHAPYIVNLANNSDEAKYNFSINFLKNEVARCEEIGIKYIVLHPGSSVGLDRNVALDNIINALNIIIKNDTKVVILLETMAGKGTELGCSLEEIKYIMENINEQDKIGVCLDTCHLNDAGYNMHNFDEFLNKFNEIIDLNFVKCIHINDSKNEFAHENFGLGKIGFESLIHIIYHEKLKGIPKILETPYVTLNDTTKERLYPPYKFEIEMLKKGEFNSSLFRDTREFYKK